MPDFVMQCVVCDRYFFSRMSCRSCITLWAGKEWKSTSRISEFEGYGIAGRSKYVESYSSRSKV